MLIYFKFFLLTLTLTLIQIPLILDSIREIFNNNPEAGRPDQGILELLEITLNNNDFEFEGQFYLQILGIAMGRKYAPSAANIYLRKFDHMAMYDFRIKPKLYSRFLDDIFGVWLGSRQELQAYQEFLNSLIPGIKVTFTATQQIIEFLDVHVYKQINPSGSCTLQTKVYFKPTDTHQLLHRTSFHPPHTFKGIVKSQFIRFKRILSTIQDYNQACSTLINVLIHKGYGLPNLIKSKRDIWHKYIPRDPNQSKSEDGTDSIPVITYWDHIHARLNEKWTSLIRSNHIFNEVRVVAAYKKHKNLRDMLVKGRFGSSQEDPAEANLQALIDVLARDFEL